MEYLIGRYDKVSRGAGISVWSISHCRMLGGLLIRLPKQGVNSGQCLSSPNCAGVSVVIRGLP